MVQDKRLLSVKEACKYLGVSRMTLLEAEERGLIAPERTVGGHRRYTVEALRELLKLTRSRHEQRVPMVEAEGTFQLSQFIADLHNRARTPENVLKESLRNLVLLLHVEMGAVYLHDATGNLRLQAAFGIPHWFLAAMAEVRHDSVSGEVLRRRRFQVYDRRSCTDLPAQLEIGQGLCAPLIYQNEVLGCVHIITRQQHQFFPAEITTVTTIAVYLASLVVNTQLLEQVQTRLRELALLSQLSQAMETTPDIDPLLEIFIDEALRLVGEETGTIYLGDETEQYLYLKTARGALDWFHHIPVRTDTGIIGWMFQNMQPYYSPCLRDDPLLPPEFIEGVSTSPTVSCLCLPMRTSNRIVGVLSINTLAPRTFTTDEIRVLMIASSKAAVAIHRARLLTAAQRNAAEQRQLNATHATILDGIRAGIAAVNEAGTVTVWNRAIEHISGISREQALGHSPLVVAPDLAPIWAAMEHTLADNEARSVSAHLASGMHVRFEVRPIFGTGRTTGALIEAMAASSEQYPPTDDGRGLCCRVAGQTGGGEWLGPTR